MKNKIVLVFLALILFAGNAKSDEGMWLLTMLNKLNLEQKGLEISPEQIYSLNNSSIKDAIVGLGTTNRPFRHFCTGQVVSDQGLLLTNHHCGYGYIQKHSSIDHDYLTNGFWAMTKEGELPNSGLTVSFLVSVEDVTAKVAAGLTDDMDEETRNQKITEISDKLTLEATEETHYTASVKSMYEGNQYFIFVYEIFKDVRFVGAPPSSIGKFGGDTDNWMWPRHTGDFSVFRVYSGPDGKPAEYSEENIPYEPKHVLPVSLDGYKEGDYSMIIGYPGSTQRYLSSYGINEQVETVLPIRIKARTEILSLMKQDMNDNAKVRIQYSSKYYRSSNGWKYFIGQRKGLKRLKVYDKKKNIENELSAWIASDDARKQKYSEAIPLIEEAFTKREKTNLSYTYLTESLLSGHDIINYAKGYRKLFSALNKETPDNEKIKSIANDLLAGADDYFKDYNQPTDKKILKSMMKMYYEGVPKEDHPSIYALIQSKYKGDFDKFIETFYKKTIFADPAKVKAFLANPDKKVLEKDMAFQTMLSINAKFKELISVLPADELNKGRRLFLGALMEMNNDKLYYPDANSTLRLSYGFVGGYNPRDAVSFDYTTTTEGILEKEDPQNDEFIVDQKMKELIEKEDFGPYGEGPHLITCFLGNHDSTGGNSGTATLNGKGELIGLLFDGNWEAMSGDIFFETPIQKSINVDIRYVLFVIDKVGGAKHLVDEMILVKTSPEEIKTTEEDTSANADMTE